MAQPKKIKAYFYRSASGREPVRDWLMALDIEDRKIVGKDIQKIEFGWPIGMPYSRPMGRSLHEVRSHLSSSRIARVLFGIEGDRMVLLHAFVKKTQKTPVHDLDVAVARWKEITG
jgi:phage-related protein